MTCTHQDRNKGGGGYSGQVKSEVPHSDKFSFWKGGGAGGGGGSED